MKLDTASLQEVLQLQEFWHSAFVYEHLHTTLQTGSHEHVLLLPKLWRSQLQRLLLITGTHACTLYGSWGPGECDHSGLPDWAEECTFHVQIALLFEGPCVCNQEHAAMPRPRTSFT